VSKDLEGSSCSLPEGTILVLATKTMENHKNLGCESKTLPRTNIGTIRTQISSVNTTLTHPIEFTS
jgi:hypothetical protein